ncbi:MAG TPA: ATP-binding protein [Vicinamibacterales bacterium]|nr:ATP-binding protein [Vicinamibacterales bacterium]
MINVSGRWRGRLREFAIAFIAVPATIALSGVIPLVRDRPSMVGLAIAAGVVTLVGPAPGILAVVCGAIGTELLRSGEPLTQLTQRSVIFLIIGFTFVAMSHFRRTRRQVSEEYRTLFDRHPLPMWLFDDETLAFLKVNEAAILAYGFSAEEFSRMTLEDIRPKEGIEALSKRPWRGQPEFNGTSRHRTKEGRLIDVYVRLREVSIDGRKAQLVLIEDVTEQRQLEEQLRQSQKMEAVGQLAGGVAHDFNNLLTAIQGYATMLGEALPAGSVQRDEAREISRAADRAAELTRQLLAFSRKQMFELRVISISEIVQDITPMLRRLVNESIEVVCLPRARGLVKADPVQLQQVLLNLIVNARDAIGNVGGRITVETGDALLDATNLLESKRVPPGKYVTLRVSDSGDGMDADTQVHIFEPFFTTKPQGRGTGLGLSTVYGIIKQSGGHISVESQPGRGTTFTVYLPLTDEAPAVRADAPSPAPRHEGSRILVVEDEDGVRRLVTKVLEKHGYCVEATGHPTQAVALASAPTARYDLLVTDVVLPELSGREVADAVRKSQPDCRVLFMSGYTDDHVMRQGILHAEALFLQKPFKADALVQKVAEALSAERQPVA